MPHLVYDQKITLFSEQKCTAGVWNELIAHYGSVLAGNDCICTYLYAVTDCVFGRLRAYQYPMPENLSVGTSTALRESPTTPCYRPYAGSSRL